jgi:hypothetical protein
MAAKAQQASPDLPQLMRRIGVLSNPGPDDAEEDIID